MTATLLIVALAIAPALAPTLQVEGGALDDLALALLVRLESVGCLGFHRLAQEGELAAVAPALPGGEGDYRVFRRSLVAGLAEYRPVARLRGDRLERLLDGRAVPGLRSGDLLVRDGRLPRVAVRAAPAVGVGVPAAFAALLESTLRARLAATGLYRIWNLGPDWDSYEVVVDAGLPELRRKLRRDGADAALNVVVAVRGERLAILCQVVAADPRSDELFGLSAPLAPELALLLQVAGEETPALPGRLLLTLPMPDGALDVAAAELDGGDGDELAVLTPSEILVYAFRDAELELTHRVSLADLPPAPYPTRSPAGRLLAGDIDRDGRLELLAACNLWAAGAEVEIGARHVVRPLALQPLALTSEGGGPALVGGRYIAGEDTFGGALLLGDGETVAPAVRSLQGLRSLHRLDPGGFSFVVVGPAGAAALWRRDGESESLPFGPVAALACSPRLAAGLALYAEAGTGGGGGDRLVVANIVSPSAAAAAILTSLDIVAIAPYNPPGTDARAVAVIGRRPDGGAVLACFGWPQ